jgi:hypothetical protein
LLSPLTSTAGADCACLGGAAGNVRTFAVVATEDLLLDVALATSVDFTRMTKSTEPM